MENKSMKPILFNTEMVRAILDGTKTVTRRVLKNQDVNAYIAVLCEDEDDGSVDLICENADKTTYALYNKIPYKEGDILYVRETWAKQQGLYWHKAGLELDENGRVHGTEPPDKWKPSIHMPKEAARIFLRVTGVRAERLQDITITGLQEEGILNDGYISQYAAMTTTAFEDFKDLWDSTIKKADLLRYGWAANPWVWVIEFERIRKEV